MCAECHQRASFRWVGRGGAEGGGREPFPIPNPVVFLPGAVTGAFHRSDL